MRWPKLTTVLFLLAIIACIIIAFSIPQGPNPENSSQQQLMYESSKIPEDEFCLGGCPIGTPTYNEIVKHHILELSNNPKTKFADWVAYKINRATLGSGCKRIWKSDPSLESRTTLRPSDYKELRASLASDRGHQAPLASLCGSPYWEEADYLSNITPQKTNLNEGAWERLENSERQLITDNITATVYSITGPLYEREMPKLPDATQEHTVPSGYWKIITLNNQNSIEATGFIMDQETARDTDFCLEHVSINQIENRTHLNFFPSLSNPAKDNAQHLGEGLLRALGC